MAYNNGFPVGYQYYMPQYQPMMQQSAQAPQPQPQTNGVIWVQGEAAARSYLMAPNTTLPLWDSESNTIFLKSTDAAGMPSMKILDYTIRDTAPANSPMSAPAAQPSPHIDYATRADVEALAGQISTLRAELDSMTAKRTTKKEAANNE